MPTNSTDTQGEWTVTGRKSIQGIISRPSTSSDVQAGPEPLLATCNVGLATVSQRPCQTDSLPRAKALNAKLTWQEWPEVTVQLSNLPTHTRTADLWKALSPYGRIIFIQISRAEYGSNKCRGRVRFSPVPETSFWNTGVLSLQVGRTRVKTVGARLLEPRPVEMVKSTVTGANYPADIRMNPAALEFGFLSQETTMNIMRRIEHLGNGKHSLTMTLRLKPKKLCIEFPCLIPDPRKNYPGNQETEAVCGKERKSEFRVEIRFSSITKLYQVEMNVGHWALVIPLASPPAFYKRKKNLESSHRDDRREWGDYEAWQRVGEVTYDTTWARSTPTSLSRPFQHVDVGRWTTYRLLFSEADRPRWSSVKSAFQDFNVHVVDTSTQDFTTRVGSQSELWTTLDAPATSTAETDLRLLHSEESVYLPFDVRYQLEVAISRNVFPEQSVTLDFLRELSRLGGHSSSRITNRARNILEYAVDQSKQKRPLDPMVLLKDPSALTHYSDIQTKEHLGLVRKVIVTPSTIHLCTPTYEFTNRVLRQYSKNIDLFIRVQFTDEESEGRISSVPDSDRNDNLFNRVFRTLENGLVVGGRHYQFLAFGNSQFREHGAYFFCPTEAQTCDDIRNWMGDFNHIRVVAKYASRLGQCFSTTRAPRGMSFNHIIQEVPDIEKNGWCFSDGVGRIGVPLAQAVADKLRLTRRTTPSAFQFRLGGNKGILVTWDHAKWNEIHLRPSQKKFTALAKSIEIIRPSRFSAATLNRQTIAILSCLGVHDAVFVDLAKHQLAGYQLAMTDAGTATRLLGRFIDENGVTTSMADMIAHGFLETNEPFLETILQLWRAWSMKMLREKARVVVEQGAMLFGCVDETYTLRGCTNLDQSDFTRNREALAQIFLQVPSLEDPDDYRVITGLCVVGRNPSLHPGDLRVVEAVDIAELHHLRDVVIFPAKGDRDIPSMCSGGDLDGDDYFVLWDHRLVPEEWNYPPMHHDAIKPTVLDRDVLVRDITRFFVEYMKNDSLGQIANAHVAMADKLVEGPKSDVCIELAKLHSNAVDYVKTGLQAHMKSRLRPESWPHFMGKPSKTYRSGRVLGKLYDMVSTIDFAPKYDGPFDERILRRYQLDDEILAKARQIKSQYDIAMRRIMNQREIATEFEIWSTFVMSKPRIGTEYKVQEDIGVAMAGLKERFVAACLEASGAQERETEVFYPFIAATYRVTWEEVQVALQQCKETRVVAGHHMPKRRLTAEQMPLISFPWVFHHELGRIAAASDDKGMALDEVTVPRVVQVAEGETPAYDGVVYELGNGSVMHRGTELFTGAGAVDELDGEEDGGSSSSKNNDDDDDEDDDKDDEETGSGTDKMGQAGNDGPAGPDDVGGAGSDTEDTGEEVQVEAEEGLDKLMERLGL